MIVKIALLYIDCLKNLLVSIVACLTLVFAMPSHAGVQLNRFSITPYIGAYTFDSEIRLVRQTNPVGGLKIGYDLTDRWGIDLVGMIDTAGENGVRDNLYKNMIRLEGLYDLRVDSRLIPFLAVGGGSVSFHPDSKITGSNLIFDYGLGAKYFIRKNLALRADIRHLLMFSNGAHDRNDFEYLVGATWYFRSKQDRSDASTKTPSDSPLSVGERLLDTDGDGVSDNQDRCAGTPLGITVNAEGCPLLDKTQLDSDGDQIADDRDLCPGTPLGVRVDFTGCPLKEMPEEKIVVVAPPPIVPTPEKTVAPEEPVSKEIDPPPSLIIHFDFDSTEIRAEYQDEMVFLAAFLDRTPETNVTIFGYTDSIGTEEYNLVLSQQRADRVMDVLVTLGVTPARLTAMGYGESQLIVDDITDENRQTNRRVEIVFTVGQKETP